MLNLGTEKITALHLGGEQIQKAYLGETLVFGAGTGPGPSRLPEGYAEVEYIQSSGTQKIDTGQKPFANIIITIDFSPMEDGSSVQKNAFYSYYYYSANSFWRFSLTWKNDGLWLYCGNASAANKTLSADNTARRMIVAVDGFNKKAFVDGEPVASLSSANTTFSTNMPTIKLLGDSGTNLIAAKLYSCKIENSAGILLDFVPCIDPTGAVGLYDLVGGKFYGNAGTGAFIAGPTI